MTGNEIDKTAGTCCGVSGSGAPGEQPCCRFPHGATQEADNASAPFPPWIEDALTTPLGNVPRVAARLTLADRLGTWKARWGVGRMRYAVPPGLYALGDPAPESPVLVSANYKMSFDRLRSQLGGRDAWILVLDTRGINVWCAAGKGTFGTDEIVTRAEAARLREVVSHRTLVLPQLGAPGVAAHEVRRRSGFRVRYGPVRAQDLPAYLDAGMEATPEMRRVRFPFLDRVVLIPVELMLAGKWMLLAAVAFFVLSGLSRQGYSLSRLVEAGPRSVSLLILGYLAGAALTPALLPWIPFRAFSGKGALLGLLVAIGAVAPRWLRPGGVENPLDAAAWLFTIPAVSSFLAMNFTGASTYTSLSGVRREVRDAMPWQGIGGGIGVALWVIGRFV